MHEGLKGSLGLQYVCSTIGHDRSGMQERELTVLTPRCWAVGKPQDTGGRESLTEVRDSQRWLRGHQACDKVGTV